MLKYYTTSVIVVLALNIVVYLDLCFRNVRASTSLDVVTSARLFSICKAAKFTNREMNLELKAVQATKISC